MTCAHPGCRMKPGTSQLCVHHRPDSDFPECSICLKAIRRTKDTLDCNHIFHRRCIDYWFQRANTCPVCRAPITVETTDWLEGLHNVMREQFAHAVRDMEAGAGRVDIHIQFNLTGGATFGS